MSFHEDDPPNEPPPTLPPEAIALLRELDTLRPPPIDFTKMNDSAKLDWLCANQLRLTNEIVKMHQKINALGEPKDPSSPTLWSIVENNGEAVSALAQDLELFREHLLGKGASVHDLRRAAARRASAPPDDPDL